MSAPQLSHLNAAGEAHMVEVGLLTLYDMLKSGWWCRPICC
jgi:molybdenum cofactor biosynthesis enzyme